MKTQWLAIILASAFLTACAAHTGTTRPNADAFLQPTKIEGRYHSLDEVMADPCSTTRDILDFGGNAEDALKRANDDKASARKILDSKPVSCQSKDSTKAHASTKTLQYTDGICSGTAVHPHTLLTATHCMEGGPLVQASGAPVQVLAQVDDGNDHTLVTVDVKFSSWSPIHQRMPIQGETIAYWGNPLGLTDVYRRGYVAGICRAGVECMKVTVGRTGATPTGLGYMLVMPGARGDSGSGLFDSTGAVIGVVSAIHNIGDGLIVMEGLPLGFSKETLGAMK